jgi:hypothetical protein
LGKDDAAVLRQYDRSPLAFPRRAEARERAVSLITEKHFGNTDTDYRGDLAAAQAQAVRPRIVREYPPHLWYDSGPGVDMPYAGFRLDDVPVLLDAEPAGVASIAHDERARLRISVCRDDDRLSLDALLAVFGVSGRPTITSHPGTAPSLRVERAVHGSTHNNVQEFRAHEAIVIHGRVPDDAHVVHRYYVTGLHFVGGRCGFQAGGVRWSLDLSDRSEDERPLDGCLPVMATLSSDPVEARRADEMDEIASTVILLASFAAGGDVWEVRRDQVLNGEVVHRRLRDNRRASMSLSPLALELAPPETLRSFIESSYPHAVSVQQTLPLRRLIRTLLHLRGETVVDTKGLLAAHFLEVLRYHYALRVLCPAGRAVRRKRDFYRNAAPAAGGGAGCAVKNKGKKLSFEEILTDFCGDHRITRWKHEFTRFRNEMFHGLELRGPRLLDQYWHVMDVAHFCDVVVLALLRWDLARGQYVPCNKEPYTREKRDGRVLSFGVNLQPFVR